MSVTELPVNLYLQQSSSFCNSLKNDLEEFIRKIDSDFSAVDRNVKVAPKLRRKSTIADHPGSCTLDLKEFTRSKDNVLRAMKTNFAEMKMKWNNDIAELRDWFIMNVESCLSKIQLQVTVTADELNVKEPLCELDLCEDDSSSSSSEINVMPAPQQTSRQFYNRGHFTSAVKKKVSFADTPKAKRTRVIPVEKTTDTSPPAKRARVIPVEKTTDANTLGMKNKIDWVSLLGATEVAPPEPGMYEVKQSRAKNSAYIGYSEDLQKCLQQYWEGKSSHDKQKKLLENFIQRNKEEISIRYEVYSSLQCAKLVQKMKLTEFLEQHKKYPSHNYDM